MDESEETGAESAEAVPTVDGTEPAQGYEGLYESVAEGRESTASDRRGEGEGE